LSSQKRIEKPIRIKLSFWRSKDNSSYPNVFFCDNVPKGQIIEAALEFMKQNKSKDLEVSDLPTEDVKVDGIPRDVYYTGKAIRRLPLSEAMSSVPWPRLCHLGDNCNVFENFRASIGDLIVAN
jgi:hypothetical protein